MKYFLLIVCIIVCTACSGTIKSSDISGNAKNHIYVINERIADRLIYAAMKTEFEEKSILKLSSDIGYSSSVDWGIDTDAITVSAIPAQGIDDNNNTVQGYTFEANHTGTAPAAGAPTIKRLMAKLVSDAEKIGMTAKAK
ncbi:hypothetical protein ACFSJY_05010 [Thalassotalea euphylliae]|uniref:hypothetical protein n=1 Tax=Thalassotalea euphylliae TaxID=1655234 RepID=UPI0036389442